MCGNSGGGAAVTRACSASTHARGSSSVSVERTSPSTRVSRRYPVMRYCTRAGSPMME